MTREANYKISPTLGMQKSIFESIEDALGTSSVISCDFEKVIKDQFINDLESLEEFRIINLKCLHIIKILKNDFEFYSNEIDKLEKGKKE